ncbi:MAG TPA: hypothetical protein VLA45_19905, partial [Paracoccaceae bacterium]|nr:hypothetical protein [Paracoccaceae bacterium]
MMVTKGAATRLPFSFSRLALVAALLGAASALAQPAPEPASGFNPKRGIDAKRFVLSAAHPLAVEAGYQVLRRGGSAIDAVVATQMVLNLVEP